MSSRVLKTRRVDAAILAQQVADLTAELELRRKSGSATDRLHNLCEGIAKDADGSEWSREEWERLDVEMMELKKDNKRLTAELAAALAQRADEPAAFHNPWRTSLENCINGDNYLRVSELCELIDELDDLYRLRAAPAAPAYVPLSDREIAGLMLDVDDPLIWGRLGEGQGDMLRQFSRAIEALVVDRMRGKGNEQAWRG